MIPSSPMVSLIALKAIGSAMSLLILLISAIMIL